MAFNSKPQDYKMEKELPETPYSKANEVWDKLMGAAIVRFKTWRMVACISMILNLVLVLGICFIGSRSSIIPYIVQVDDKSGAILSVDRVDARSRANETEVEYFLWNVTRKEIFNFCFARLARCLKTLLFISRIGKKYILISTRPARIK